MIKKSWFSKIFYSGIIGLMFFAIFLLSSPGNGNFNDAPELTYIGSTFVTPDETLVLTLTATDPNPSDTVFLVADGLPSDATFIHMAGNPGTGLLQWTPNMEDIGMYEVIFTASDDGIPQLSTTLVVEIIVSASPDTDARIAFSSGRDGNAEIYVMNLDGTGQTRLTYNDAWDSLPSWSPNGNKIAFTSFRDGTYEIYVMNADGTGQTNLTNNSGWDSLQDWSPDGNQIAFVSGRDNGNGDIFIMNADGTGQTNITNSPLNVGNRNPSWSPDGTQIAFSSNRDGNGEIHVMNADGTGITNLTNNLASDSDPSWSPDGTQIAFVSNRDGNDEIYVMNSDGTMQTRLTSNPSYDWQPSWSPDGKKLVFSSDLDGNYDIYMMNSDGTELSCLTNSTDFSNYYPDWGKRIIHVPADYSTIQAAIDAAYDGDIVLVADGTYTGVGNRDLDFLGKAITVKSENGPDNCIIDCDGSGRGFYLHRNEVVSGFTIINGHADYGGGIYCSLSGATITNCTISNNSATFKGGGIYCLASEPTITNCIISGNYTSIGGEGGGGIYCDHSDITITNSIINFNLCILGGGGIYCEGGSLTITNCTIIDNTSIEDGGGIYCLGGFNTITNCILWSNSTPGVYFDFGIANITYCNIQGGHTGEGNIDSDPLLNWDFHLQSSSPCIDAGIDTIVLPDTDFEGDPRIIDGDFDGNAVVDMGADEFVPYNTPAGSYITVTPTPGVTVTFETVEEAGQTSCETSSINPAPDQGVIGFLGTYYDINTTASYTGEITITLNYDEADIPTNMDENDLRIYHLDGTIWVDITSSINTDQNFITGSLFDLSWFAIGIPNQNPIADAGEDQIDVPVGVDCMASVTLDGSQSSDPENDPLTYSWTWDSGSASGVNPTILLPLGTHTIILTVDDGKGGTDSDTVTITVIDNTPPEINVSVSPSILWPPNHKMVLITPAITVSDNCDPNPVVVLTSITMNEGEETNTYDSIYDTTVGDGHTLNDIQIDLSGNVYLRAERSGTGTGRIYTLTYTVTDASGNSTTASVTVTVPHDQK